jgi:hypothetical protein
MSLQSHGLVLAAGLLCAAAAQAGVAVTADLGSTGVGAHLVVPMETYLNGRFGINYLKHDFDKTSGAIRYDIKGKVQTVDALFDFYPRAGSTFRLTGGLVYNGSKFDARANPDALGKFLINGVEYGAADVGLLHGRIDFRKAAPYLGLGWGNALAPAAATQGRWSVNADIGAYYQGHPNVQLQSIGCATSAAVCSALASNVAAERVRLQAEAASFKFYPVLRAGVSYRF